MITDICVSIILIPAHDTQVANLFGGVDEKINLPAATTMRLP